MQRNDKGITIVALLVTIVLLVILTGVSLNTGYTVVKDIRIGRIISNMSLVKAKAETIYEQYQFSGNENDLIGIKMASIDFIPEEEIQVIIANAENKEFGSWTWYEWNSDTLKSQGLDKNMLGDDEHFYVNYESGEIVYSKGTSYTTNGTKYFSMTGLNYLYENN